MMPHDDATRGLQAQLDAARAELTRVQKCSERLAQLYAARSQCSAAILRCHDEAELFPVVCRAAVERGGLSMAWIGMVRQATGRVEPVASFGDEQQYLRLSTTYQRGMSDPAAAA